MLGGIPDGRPLARLQIDQARAFAEHGTPIEDPVTQNYVTLSERVDGNDLRALVALAEGMRLGDADPDVAHPPMQPILFATGSDDAILEQSRLLAPATPNGSFVELPGRHHFNAPGSRVFREAALEFFGPTGRLTSARLSRPTVSGCRGSRRLRGPLHPLRHLAVALERHEQPGRAVVDELRRAGARGWPPASRRAPSG